MSTTNMEKLSFLLCLDDKFSQSLSHALKLDEEDSVKLQEFLFRFILGFSPSAVCTKGGLELLSKWKNEKKNKEKTQKLALLIKFLSINRKSMTIPVIDAKTLFEEKSVDDLEHFIGGFNEDFSLIGKFSSFDPVDIIKSFTELEGDENEDVRDLAEVLLSEKSTDDNSLNVAMAKALISSVDNPFDQIDYGPSKITDKELKPIIENKDFDILEMLNIEMFKVGLNFIPCDTEDEGARPEPSLFEIHDKLGSDKIELISLLFDKRNGEKEEIETAVPPTKAKNTRTGTTKKSLYEKAFDEIKSQCKVVEVDKYPERTDGMSEIAWFNTMPPQLETQYRWSKMTKEQKACGHNKFRAQVKKEREERGVKDEKGISKGKPCALTRKSAKYSPSEKNEEDEIVDVCKHVGEGKLFVTKNGFVAFPIGKNSMFADIVLRVNELKEKIGTRCFTVTKCYMMDDKTPLGENVVNDYCCSTPKEPCEKKHERGKCCKDECKRTHNKIPVFRGFDTTKSCAIIVTNLENDKIIPFKSEEFTEFCRNLDEDHKNEKRKPECSELFQDIYRYWVENWYMRCKQDKENFILYDGKVMSLAESTYAAAGKREEPNKALDASPDLKRVFSTYCKNNEKQLSEMDHVIQDLFREVIDKTLADSKNMDKDMVKYLNDVKKTVDSADAIIAMQKIK